MRITPLDRFVLVFAAFLISVIINGLQGRYISILLKNAEQIASKGALSVGTTVPPVEVRDSSGRVGSVPYSDTTKPTILYVFRPSCMWCQKNGVAVESLLCKFQTVIGSWACRSVRMVYQTLSETIACPFPFIARLHP